MGWFNWGGTPTPRGDIPKLDIKQLPIYAPPDPYMQWVEVEDHPPEISHRRLFLWNGHYMRYGRYLALDMGGDICAFHDDYDQMIRGRKITHYMYVPEPPKDK